MAKAPKTKNPQAPNGDAHEERAGIKPELRAEGDEAKVIAGYAAKFDERTQIGDYFIEVFRPGAFTQTLKDYDQRALAHHDRGRVIGRRSAGTLRLTEDAKGLEFEIDLPDTTDGRDLEVSIERGDINAMSFAFRSVKEEWDDTGDLPVRTVIEAELFEISPVSFPQYDGTELALRSLKNHRKTTAKHNFHATRARMKMRQDQRERGLRTD